MAMISWGGRGEKGVTRVRGERGGLGVREGGGVAWP